MNLRETGYKVDIQEKLIRPFEERVLSSGMCDFALDMTFSHYRGVNRIKYDAYGYVSINELDLTDDKKLFEVLEKTLLTLNKAGEFFIDREKVLLEVETVFYNMKYKDVKIAYYPRKECLCITESVLFFLSDLSDLASEKGRKYLSRIEGIFRRNNCDLKDMITVVGELRRTVFNGSNTTLNEEEHQYNNFL